MREYGFWGWILLGTVLLALFYLPEAVSLQLKSAVREGFAPLQGVVSDFLRQGKEVLDSVQGIGGVLKENRIMTTELVRLRNTVRELKSLESENIQLREQLQLLRRSARPLITCEVIARDISGWWNTLRLGKGSAQGVDKDLAVVTSDGLIGKTIEVSPRTSEVLLISEPKLQDISPCIPYRPVWYRLRKEQQSER